MDKIRSYISILLLVLLVFPGAEKLWHDLEHLEDEHCAIKTVHFCEADHTCSLCDYLFSGSSDLPPLQEKPVFRKPVSSCFPSVFLPHVSSFLQEDVYLRGPPEI